MRIVFSGGGTGGHIYPALAVAERLRELHPGMDMLYVGSDTGLERDLATRAGIPFCSVATRPVAGRNPLKQALALGHVMAGTAHARAILARFRPTAVLATGGYVSVPVALAASLMRLPLAIHEQNVVAGAANRMLARFAREIYTCSDEAAASFGPRAVVTGNPVRPSILASDRRQACARLGLDPSLPTVLALGGSRGAATLAMASAPLAHLALRLGFQLVVSTGKTYYDRVVADLEAEGIAGAIGGKIMIRPYLHDMADALAAADIVVARAGATTLAEVTAVGIAAVLIPSPNVVNDHQRKNARALERAGAAVVVTEDQARLGRIVDVVAQLVSDDGRRRALAGCSRNLGRRDAADVIARRLAGLSGCGARTSSG